MKNLENELQELTKEWIESKCWKNEKFIFENDKKETIGNVFVEDGVVDYTEYDKQKLKILFILKEAHTSSEEKKKEKSSLIVDIKNGVVRNFWNRLAEWSVGLLNQDESKIINFDLITQEQKNMEIRKTAIINLKKSDGDTKTDMERYVEYFYTQDNLVNEEYVYYLMKQIELINPDVIICGGTFNIFNKLFKERIEKIKDVRRGYYFWKRLNDKKAIVIDYYHPSWQNSADLLYYGLCSTYQQILKNKEDDIIG